MLIDLVEKDVVYKACLGFGVYETTKLQYFICMSNIFFMFFYKILGWNGFVVRYDFGVVFFVLDEGAYCILEGCAEVG
jgi:hypothetical protein